MSRIARVLSVVWLFGAASAHPAWAVNSGLGPPPPETDRSTPSATVQGFFDRVHGGDYVGAAHYLNLDPLPRSTQAQEGPRLARRLRFVLDRALVIDFAALSREEGKSPTRTKELLGTIQLKAAKQPIGLDKVTVGGEPVWVFGAETVRAIDGLYEELGPPLGEVLPEFWFGSTLFGLELWQWVGLLLLLVVGTLFALLLGKGLTALLHRVTRLTHVAWDDQLVEGGKGPVRLILWSIFMSVGTRLLYLPQPGQHAFDLVARSLLILAFTIFALRAIAAIAQYVQKEVKPGEGGLDRDRRLKTQVSVLRGVVQVAVYLVAAALFLMQFEVVRSVGVSLLASAGIAGLVVGLAAQKSISSLLAGIQLSLTQPIHIGDNIVVEGEYGTIEEINLTYVVVRVWDLRRMIIPITQFLDKPFQNWSRGSGTLLGAVELQVDFRMDVEVVRQELKRLLETEAKSLWDGGAQVVHVTGSTDKVMTIRVLVSAADPDKVFDLRCLLRERLLAFIGRQPRWLPTVRSESSSRETEQAKA